jgi:hypothetical protein
MRLSIAIVLLLALALGRAFRGPVVLRRFGASVGSSSSESKDEGFDIKKAEAMAVEKGLTHIKQNKYAPPPLEAAKMTQEQFRAYMYKEMKDAERIRRAEQGGVVGSQVSDDYINSLSAKKKSSD